MSTEGPFVPGEWLQGSVDVREVESSWLDKPGPYGVSSEKWRTLLAGMRTGDEIRAFSSPPESWRNLAGRAGYALVRDGRAIDGVVTLLN